VQTLNDLEGRYIISTVEVITKYTTQGSPPPAIPTAAPEYLQGYNKQHAQGGSFQDPARLPERHLLPGRRPLGAVWRDGDGDAEGRGLGQHHHQHHRAEKSPSEIAHAVAREIQRGR